MKKTDYVLLIFAYLLGTVVSITSGYSTVTNPGPSDWVVSGLGSLAAAFIFTSVFTLPIQYFGGWDKYEYVRKTLIASIILFALLIIKGVGI